VPAYRYTTKTTKIKLKIEPNIFTFSYSAIVSSCTDKIKTEQKISPLHAIIALRRLIGLLQKLDIDGAV